MKGMSEKLWGQVEVQDDQCYVWKLRDLWFWVRRRRDEWFLLLDRQQAKEAGRHGEDIPEEASSHPVYAEATETPQVEGWSRYVTLSQDSLRILPALPDRALVVRPFMKVSLLPDRWAQFYVAIPLWISLIAGKTKNQTVFEEFPSKQLSNTWFGSPQSGELCYALHTPLMRVLPEQHPGDDFLICPLVIRNASSETLQFQRLCIHVDNLEIFKSKSGLVTNQVNVLFKGGAQPTQIDTQKKPPAGIEKIELLRGPREAMNRTVLRKTFDVFKEITGF